MPKTVFLKEEQIEYINNAMKEQEQVPSQIIDALNDNDTFIPLNDTNLSKKLLSKGYKAIKDSFSDNIEQVPLSKAIAHFNKLMTLCNKKEKNIKPQLEKLCYNTLVQIFNIPEDEIVLSCEIVDFIDDGMEFHISPDTDEEYEYESIKEMNLEDTEVQKRKIINTLVIGAAQKAFDSSKNLYINKLFDIDEELPHIYSKLMKLNLYLLFKRDVKIKDGSHHQGGFVKVVLGDDKKLSKIEVKALNFPILLLESIKGVLELISSNGLPDELSVARNVVNKADVLQDEPWEMRYGYGLWNMVTLGSNMDTKLYPDFFSKLIDIKSDEFISLMNELSHNTRQGKESIKELIDDCEYSFKYNNFKDDLMKQQDERNIIENGYFTPEDLSRF